MITATQGKEQVHLSVYRQQCENHFSGVISPGSTLWDNGVDFSVDPCTKHWLVILLLRSLATGVMAGWVHF